jgi:hypothetical protein
MVIPPISHLYPMVIPPIFCVNQIEYRWDRRSKNIVKKEKRSKQMTCMSYICVQLKQSIQNYAFKDETYPLWQMITLYFKQCDKTIYNII